MLELISPAGSPEAVEAAVQNGADGVFFSVGRFTGSHRAQGFSDEEFKDAIRYCRVRGCKAYIALNVLVSDIELTEVSRTAHFAAEQGADAIIVRDIGLARVLRQVLPDTPLHGDAHMGIHDLGGLHAAAELGLSRVVLASELPRESIRRLCERSPVELGVIAQGESCVSESGLCYLSSVASGKSAGRGLCDRRCQGDFSLGGRKDDHPLQMKDLCLLEHVSELEAMGLGACILEGRGNRPEITGLLTNVYCNAIRNRKQPTAEQLALLQEALSSEGFTDGYYTDRKGPEMFGVHEQPSSRAYVRSLASLRRDYTQGELRRVKVHFSASIAEGERARFSAEDEQGNRVDALGPYPTSAAGRGMTFGDVEQELYRTAGTPYSCAGVTAEVAPGLMITKEEFAEVRARLLERLSEKRGELHGVRTGSAPAFPRTQQSGTGRIIFHALSLSQLSPELAEMEPDYLYLPYNILLEGFSELDAFWDRGAAPVAVLPGVLRDDEKEPVLQKLRHLRALGVREALISSLGHLPLVRAADMAARGDYGLNVFNSYTAELLSRAGLLSCTASFELSGSQLRQLRPPLDTEILVYGRLPVMTTACCILKNSAGKCNCSSPGQLSDGRGLIFPVLPAEGCRNTVYSSRKLFLADRKDDYEALGLWGSRLLFTTESRRECIEVARSYLLGSGYRPNGLTRGRFYKGVE